MWNPVAEEIVADPANRHVYSRQYRVFKQLYPSTSELMRTLEN
jgi:sugar (pentulose or hexulose) kinase